MRIHQLPAAIANQIAAGEVIERPASVVKELLENSLDAGADVISIEIGYGGLNQIKISDNGSGIIAEDLPLAVAAHATSKINTLNDLYAIESMGFRGEALASIASVAKVTISSKPPQQDHAVMMRVQGAECTITPCARTVGTTIDVADLFFNVPVRKRFLKNEKLEFQAIEQVVKRFALSAPNIGLTLKHNNKLILSLPAALSEQAIQTRMIKIFGNSFIKDAIFLDVEHASMRLYGWVSGPDFQRSQNDRQWVYINQRMVKDKLINHALKQAYDGLLYPGRFPACLLYFSINSAEVDVNVHPTKHEVRFQQPRLVHDFFTSQLSQALQAKAAAINEPLSDEREVLSHDSYEARPYLVQSNTTILGDDVISDFERPIYGRPNVGLIDKSRNNNRFQSGTVFYPAKNERSWVILNNRYGLIFIEQQPYLVDIIKLQYQWLYNQLKQSSLPLDSRPLLVPITYPMPPQISLRRAELQHCLSLLGIDISVSKDDAILVRTIPMCIPYVDIRLFLDSIAELKCFTIDELLKVISQSQVFDPHLLSVEERMELNQLLLDDQNNEIKSANVCKLITADDCRKLLHV